MLSLSPLTASRSERSRFGRRLGSHNLQRLGLTIDQSTVVKGETYIAMNYKANSVITKSLDSVERAGRILFAS
jgi:hypothetical protein